MKVLCSPIDTPVLGSHAFIPEIHCIYFAGIVAKDNKGQKARACAPGYKLALYLIFVHFRTFLEGLFVKYHFAVKPVQRVQVNDQDKIT